MNTKLIKSNNFVKMNHSTENGDVDTHRQHGNVNSQETVKNELILKSDLTTSDKAESENNLSDVNNSERIINNEGVVTREGNPLDQSESTEHKTGKASTDHMLPETNHNNSEKISDESTEKEDVDVTELSAFDNSNSGELTQNPNRNAEIDNTIPSSSKCDDTDIARSTSDIPDTQENLDKESMATNRDLTTETVKEVDVVPVPPENTESLITSGQHEQGSVMDKTEVESENVESLGSQPATQITESDDRQNTSSPNDTLVVQSVDNVNSNLNEPDDVSPTETSNATQLNPDSTEESGDVSPNEIPDNTLPNSKHDTSGDQPILPSSAKTQDDTEREDLQNIPQSQDDVDCANLANELDDQNVMKGVNDGAIVTQDTNRPIVVSDSIQIGNNINDQTNTPGDKANTTPDDGSTPQQTTGSSIAHDEDAPMVEIETHKIDPSEQQLTDMSKDVDQTKDINTYIVVDVGGGLSKQHKDITDRDEAESDTDKIADGADLCTTEPKASDIPDTDASEKEDTTLLVNENNEISNGSAVKPEQHQLSSENSSTAFDSKHSVDKSEEVKNANLYSANDKEESLLDKNSSDDGAEQALVATGLNEETDLPVGQPPISTQLENETTKSDSKPEDSAEVENRSDCIITGVDDDDAVSVNDDLKIGVDTNEPTTPAIESDNQIGEKNSVVAGDIAKKDISNVETDEVQADSEEVNVHDSQSNEVNNEQKDEQDHVMEDSSQKGAIIDDNISVDNEVPTQPSSIIDDESQKSTKEKVDDDEVQIQPVVNKQEIDEIQTVDTDTSKTSTEDVQINENAEISQSDSESVPIKKISMSSQTGNEINSAEQPSELDDGEEKSVQAESKAKPKSEEVLKDDFTKRMFQSATPKEEESDQRGQDRTPNPVKQNTPESEIEVIYNSPKDEDEPLEEPEKEFQEAAEEDKRGEDKVPPNTNGITTRGKDSVLVEDDGDEGETPHTKDVVKKEDNSETINQSKHDETRPAETEPEKQEPVTKESAPSQEPVTKESAPSQEPVTKEPVPPQKPVAQKVLSSPSLSRRSAKTHSRRIQSEKPKQERQRAAVKSTPVTVNKSPSRRPFTHRESTSSRIQARRSVKSPESSGEASRDSASSTSKSRLLRRDTRHRPTMRPKTTGVRDSSDGRAEQKAFFRQELTRIEENLKKESSKIHKPPQKKHIPYIFNDLKPYYDTQTVRYLIELPEELQHCASSRPTAIGLIDPWKNLIMDNYLPAVVNSKPINRQEKFNKKEQKIEEKSKRNKLEGSTRLPKYPIVTMETSDLATKKLCYSDVPMLRQELHDKYSANASKKVEEDYEKTKQDFYRMELDKLNDVHPCNREHMRSTYFAYLQNTPGSKKAINECVKSLEKHTKAT